MSALPSANETVTALVSNALLQVRASAMLFSSMLLSHRVICVAGLPFQLIPSISSGSIARVAS